MGVKIRKLTTTIWYSILQYSTVSVIRPIDVVVSQSLLWPRLNPIDNDSNIENLKLFIVRQDEL